jgi:hypothetical protein
MMLKSGVSAVEEGEGEPASVGGEDLGESFRLSVATVKLSAFSRQVFRSNGGIMSRGLELMEVVG